VAVEEGKSLNMASLLHGFDDATRHRGIKAKRLYRERLCGQSAKRALFAVFKGFLLVPAEVVAGREWSGRCYALRLVVPDELRRSSGDTMHVLLDQLPPARFKKLAYFDVLTEGRGLLDIGTPRPCGYRVLAVGEPAVLSKRLIVALSLPLSFRTFL
jgi:hypothetical protein